LVLDFTNADDWADVQEALHLAAVRFQGGSREDDVAAICRHFVEVMSE